MIAERQPVIFEGFLSHLRRCGFTIGIDHYLRVQTLVGRLGPDCSPADIETVLCPVFATNKEQQEGFYRAFEEYWPIFVPPRVPKPLLVAQEPHLPKQRRWPYIVTATLALVAAGAGIVWWRESRPRRAPATQTLPAGKKGDTIKAGHAPAPEPRSASTLEKDAPRRWVAQKDVLIPTKNARERYQEYRQMLGATAVAMPFAFWLAYEWYLMNRRRATLARHRSRRPPFRWPVRAQRPVELYRSDRIATVARRLQRRQQGAGSELDIEATVNASIRTPGILKMRYRKASRLPEYLVLIETLGPRDHQAALFRELAAALQNEGIFAEIFTYERHPRTCRSERTGERFALDDLQSHYPHHRLLIFGDAAQLLDPVTGEVARWTEAFLHWTDRVLLTPKFAAEWGLQESALGDRFVVMPATLDGLAAAADYFQGATVTERAFWRSRQPNDPEGSRLESIDELRGYLGEAGFAWLCACGVYPELEWPLTLELSRLPFLRTGIADEDILSRLVRLPWFRSGVIPDHVRLDLISALGPEREAVVRLKLRDILEHSPVPASTYAAEARRFEIAVQNYRINARNRKARRGVWTALGELPAAMAARDYVFLRALERNPKSPLSPVLPGVIRASFSNGVPVFGLRTGVRLAGAAALIGSLTLGLNAIDHTIQQSTIAPGARWESAGPSNIAGRATAIAVHPKNAEVIWLGTASGGVWKSEDAGATWRPLWNRQESLAIGSVALDPDDPNTLYVGTGEANGSTDSYPGTGIYRTRDGGENWEWLARAAPMGLPRHIGALAVDPFDSRHILMGGRSQHAGDPAGLFASNDGGKSWRSELTNREHCSSIVFDATRRGVVFVAFGGTQAGVWRSSDGGASFVQLSLGESLPRSDARIALAISASDSNHVYAVIGFENEDKLSVYVSIDGGTTWTSTSKVKGESQATYNLTIGVDPKDPYTVFCGGIDLHRTDDGGKTWRKVTRWDLDQGKPQYAHADHHALAMPSADLVYDVNDGGVDISHNRGESWTNRSLGLATAQFYDIDVSQSDAKVYGGGTQENGTILTQDGDASRFFVILGGSGGWMVIDPADTTHLFASYYNLNIERLRGGLWRDVSPLAPLSEKISIWMAFITMDPHDPKTLFTGTTRMWRTRDDGNSWKAVSQPLDGTAITAIEILRSDSARIYAGTERGGIFASVDGGDTWNRLWSGPQVITRIAATTDANP